MALECIMIMNIQGSTPAIGNKIKGMGKGRNKIHPQDRLSLAPGGTELDTDKGKPGSEMG